MRKPSFVIEIRTAMERKLTPWSFFLLKKGLTANHLTFGQLPFVFVMVYMFYIDNIFFAGLTLFVSLILDVYDGMFARITNTATQKGHYYDKIVDLVGISGFIMGLVLYIPQCLTYLIIILFLSYLIYILNEFTPIEVVGSVRSVGLFGLFFEIIGVPALGITWMELAIYTILMVSVVGTLYKIFQLVKLKWKLNHDEN